MGNPKNGHGIANFRVSLRLSSLKSATLLTIQRKCVIISFTAEVTWVLSRATLSSDARDANPAYSAAVLYLSVRLLRKLSDPAVKANTVF